MPVHNVQHQSQIRTDIANLVVGKNNLGTSGLTGFQSGINQVLKLYTGTIPTDASTGLSGNVAASMITSINWNAASNGVAQVSGTPSDSNATGSASNVTFFRLYRTNAVDPTDVIIQGTVGTGAGWDLQINSTIINAGANVTLSSPSTYTAPL